jgi:peptidyl-prolyl cis-trans isomerase D
MFDFVRSHNKLLQIGLGVLIIPAFGIFGVQSYTSMNGEESATVASVDGHNISRAEWDQQQRKDVDTARAQNPTVDVKALESPEARRASLDSIVRDRVMQAAVAHENLAVTSDRVDSYIRNSPDLAEFRALKPADRDVWLAQRGLSRDSLFAVITDQITRSQPLRGVTSSGIVPAAAASAALDALMNQREIQWQRFDTKDYAAAIQPTDAQIQAYYADKAHAAEFVAPEQAKIDYVVLDANTLKSQVAVTDDQLHKYYDDHKAQYTAPEERRASHILINVAPGASPADIAAAKAKADALLAEVRKNPASFADVAKRSSQDVGSAAQGGDLDFMRPNAIPGPFSDTLFKMKQGDISDVVRSDAGFHIIELTGVRGGSAKPFDEVRAQVEDQLRTQEAQKLFAADAEKFTNTVYEQPDSLQPAIDAFKLTKQTAVVQRKPAPGIAGPAGSQRLLDAVFGNEALHGKHNTEAVETGPSQLTSAHLVDYTPQHVRPLAEVHDQVVESVRKAQAMAAASKDGQARVAAATKDATLALPLTATVSRRGAPNVPPEVAQAALKVDLSKGPVVTGLALPDGSYAVIRVVKSLPRAADANDQEAAALKGQVDQAFEEAEALAIYDSMKTRYKTKYNEEHIAKGIDASASAPN